jgi:hypothetical protein
MCDMSKKMNKHVTRRLNTVTNIMRRRRPISGSMNSPTFTVPDEHKHAKQATDEIWNETKSQRSEKHSHQTGNPHRKETEPYSDLPLETSRIVKLIPQRTALIIFQDLETERQFRYFRMTVRNQNLIWEEIWRRMNSSNVCYRSV